MPFLMGETLYESFKKRGIAMPDAVTSISVIGGVKGPLKVIYETYADAGIEEIVAEHVAAGLASTTAAAPLPEVSSDG